MLVLGNLKLIWEVRNPVESCGCAIAYCIQNTQQEYIEIFLFNYQIRFQFNLTRRFRSVLIQCAAILNHNFTIINCITIKPILHLYPSLSLRLISYVAYLMSGDFNVFMVDWSPLTVYPCYLSSLRNTRLVSQCTAQLYARLTYSGASAYQIHCVGHSLGAHICGMISNHLTERQHKIIGEYDNNIINDEKDIGLNPLLVIVYCVYSIKRD